MDAPPLTLSVLQLRPATLLLPGDEDPPPSSALPDTPQLPTHSLPTFSPTHSYPGPHPTATLGSTFKLHLHLSNTSQSPVRGVRMMVELQGSTRYRLGEVIHGQTAPGSDPLDAAGGLETLPSVPVGGGVELEVESEVKEVGGVVCIVSVAWETGDGRRTFQRFFKYNVTPPLAIKTRIQPPGHPNSQLDVSLRDRVYLEILAQNASSEGMVFDRVFLEAVTGLQADLVAPPREGGDGKARLPVLGDAVPDRLTARSEEAAEGDTIDQHSDGRTLLPGETRQFLFVLSPTASRQRKASSPSIAPPAAETRSADAATYTDGRGTEGIAMAKDPGLGENAPLSSATPTPTDAIPPEPADLPAPSDAALSFTAPSPLPKSTFPPAHPPGTVLPLGRLDLTWRAGLSHDPGRLQTSTLNRRIPVPPLTSLQPVRALSSSPAPGSRISPRSLRVALPPNGWEFDLVLLDRPTCVAVESEFSLWLRLGVRTSSAIDEELDEPSPPPLPILGIQHLTRSAPPPEPSTIANPKFTISAPSRTQTPISHMGAATPAGAGPSRPYSPIARPLSRGTSTAGAPTISGGQGQGRSGPGTPISAAALRQASPADIGSGSPPPPSPFPLPPYINSPPRSTQIGRASTSASGQADHLGVSLEVHRLTTVEIVEERAETTYTDPIAPMRRWEGTLECFVRFGAVQEGLAELGGLRVVVFDDESLASGTVGREWNSLGDVWVEG